MDRPLEEEWREYELYEKVRVRENRKRFLIVSLVIFAFFGLCSVPVIEARMPKWKSLKSARMIWVELERMKTRSIQEKTPYQLKFIGNGKYQIERMSDCRTGEAKVIEREAEWEHHSNELTVLSPSEAQAFDLKQTVDHFCFDPVFGYEGMRGKRAFVIVPVKDLAEKNLDRASYIVIESESAKISIN